MPSAQEQADRYNKAGTVTDDGNIVSTQIGLGAYTTPTRGRWPGNADSWYCVILADSAALTRVSKVWVPETFLGTKLWYKNDAIDDYIKGFEDNWNPAKTLRMSIIDGGENDDDVQLVIPPGLMNSNKGAMGIVAYCKKTVAELPDAVVNYDDWKDNIKGDKKDVDLSLLSPGIII